jgi:hypothetical protein
VSFGGSIGPSYGRFSVSADADEGRDRQLVSRSLSGLASQGEGGDRANRRTVTRHAREASAIALDITVVGAPRRDALEPAGFA